MPLQPSDNLVRLFRACARMAGLAVMLLGIGVLACWVLGSDALAGVLRELLTVKVNTALGFVFSGASLFLLSSDAPRRWKLNAARLAAGTALLIDLLSACESVFHGALHIAQVLFRHASGDLPPGQIPPPVSLRLLLVALA